MLAKLDLKIFVGGALENNCYLVSEPKSSKAFIVDASYPADAIVAFIKKNHLNLEFVVLTHGHYDHIGGLEALDAPFYVHVSEVPVLESDLFNGSMMFGPKVSIKRPPCCLRTGANLDFCGHKIEVLHTPGHTPGSICLRLDDWLFSGDTLFCDCIGRTDLPKGSQKDIIASIKQKLFILPETLVVYPGHGPATTIGKEKRENPYVNQL
jgi:hydroxyacylglutathione hydrolase